VHWAYLALAIAFEVAGTTAMKLSDGFRKPGWALAMFVAYTACFALVAVAIRRIELGVAYAIWAGVGTAVVAVLGVAVFGEPLTALKVAGVVLIVLGVVALNLGGVTR
jgi:small multidrug resistance pump